MKAGAALAAWLADCEAQDRSLAAVEACVSGWRRNPLMTDIEREMGEASDPSPQQLLDSARRFFDRADDIAVLLKELVAESRADPFFRPPFYPTSGEIHTGLLLYHHPRLSLILGVTGMEMLAAKKSVKRGATSIAFTGHMQMFRYLKAGNATVSFWEAPPIDENFVAAEAGKARFAGRRRIADGEEIVIDGRYQSFIIEHAESDILYFQALLHSGDAPLATEYDSHTLELIGASSTNESSSRVQMMVSLLRTMNRADAFPVVREFLADRHFYVRWHVMREMLAMDADAALPDLRRLACDDPHPEVRAAAEQTLRLFFDEESGPATEGKQPCRA